MTGPAALGVIQARISSTRLPGKVLADVGGEPMLGLQLRRLSRSAELARIVVATSVDPGDDAVAEVAEQFGARVHRGPLDDVLGRVAGAAAGHDGPVARLTADCPLIDPAVVDATIRLFASHRDCAYASNFDPRTFPDGLDTEVLSPAALAAAAAAATDPADREHVTPYVRARPEEFPAVAHSQDEDLGALRWTVDDAADLEFVRAVTARLGERRWSAGWREVLTVVRAAPSLGEHGLRG